MAVRIHDIMSTINDLKYEMILLDNRINYHLYLSEKELNEIRDLINKKYCQVKVLTSTISIMDEIHQHQIDDSIIPEIMKESIWMYRNNLDEPRKSVLAEKIKQSKFEEIFINTYEESGAHKKENSIPSVKERNSDDFVKLAIELYDKKTVVNNTNEKRNEYNREMQRKNMIRKKYHDYSLYEGVSGISLRRQIFQEGYLRGHCL